MNALRNFSITAPPAGNVSNPMLRAIPVPSVSSAHENSASFSFMRKS